MAGTNDDLAKELSPGSHSGGLKEDFEKQQTLITQMKDALRKNEKQFSGKEKAAEEYANKLSDIKSRTRKSLLLSPKPEGYAEMVQSKHTPSKDSKKSIESDKVTPSKALTLLRQKVNENRAIFEQRGREMTENKRGVEVMVEQLKAQLDERDTTIRELQTKPTHDSRPQHTATDGAAVHDEYYAHQEYMEDASGLPLSKDYQIAELSNKVLALEAVIVGLQENLLEKDSVINARTKAISLMSEDLCRKSKSTVDQLEETREEMRRMQNNFVAHETDMKREKDALNLKLEAKSKRLLRLEETNKELESIRTELNSRVSELQAKLENVAADQIKEDHIKELTSSLLDANKQISEQQEKLELLEDIDTKKQQEMNVLTAQITDLQEKLSLSWEQAAPIDDTRQQEKIDELTASLTDANNKVIELQEKLNTSSWEQAASIDDTRQQEKIDELTASLTDANNKVAELQEKLNSSSWEQAAAIDDTRQQEKIDELTASLTDANNKVAELQAQLEHFASGIESARQEKVGELTASLPAVKEKLSEERMGESAAANDIAHQEKITQLTASLSDANKQIIKLKAQTKKQLKQLNSLKKVSDANAKIVDLQNRIAELEEEKVSESLSEERIVELESRIATLGAENKLQEDLVPVLETARHDLEARITELEGQVVELQDKLRDVEEMKVRAELRAVELEEDVDIAVKEKLNLADMLQALQGESSDNQSVLEHNEMVEQIIVDQVEACVLECKQETDALIADFNAQLSAKTEYIQTFEDQIKIVLGTQNATPESWIKEIEAFKNKIESLELHVNELETDSRIKDEQFKFIEKELMKKELDLGEKINEHIKNDEIIGKLTDELNALQRELQLKNNQIQESVAVHAKQTEKMKKLVANLKARTLQAKGYDENVNALKLLIDEKDSVIADLKRAKDEANEKQRLLENENSASQLEAAAARKQIALFEEQLQQMYSNFTQENSLKTQLESQLWTLEQEFVVFREKSDKELLGAQNTIATLKHEISDLEKLKDTVEHTASVEQQLQQSYSNLEQEKSVRIELENQLSALKQEFVVFQENSDKELVTAQTTTILLKQELSEFEERLKSLQIHLQEKDVSIENMVVDINNMQEVHNSQLFECNSMITSQQGYISEKEKEIAHYLDQLNSQHSIIEELQKQCTTIQATLQSVEGVEAKVTQQEAQLLEAQEMIADKERQYMQSLAASDAKLQEQQAVTESLDAELKKTKDRILRLEASLEESNEIQKMLENKNNDLNVQLEESGRSRDMIVEKESILAEKLQGMMSGSESIRVELKSLEETNAEYSQLIADLKSQIPELEKNLTNAQNRLKVVQAENERLLPLEHQLEKSCDEVDALKTELSRSTAALEQHCQALRADLDKANSNVDAVCSQFDQCDSERRNASDKCVKLEDEKLGLESDLEEANNRLEDSLARIGRLEQDADELGSKLHSSEELARTLRERNESIENKLDSTNIQFEQYSIEAEQKLQFYGKEVESTKEALEEERNRHMALQVQVQSLQSEYESKLSILEKKNSQLKELIRDTETLKDLCEKEVSNIITRSKEQVGEIHSESCGEEVHASGIVDEKDVDTTEGRGNTEQVSIDLFSSWNEAADEGWAWGSDEAKLEEEHQVGNKQKESSSENITSDLTYQLEMLDMKVKDLEAEKEKLSAELKAAQVRNGKLLKKLRETKPKPAESNSLDQTMEKEFILQIGSLEKELQVLKADKDASVKEKQQLKYRAEALEWQISELSEDKSKLSESIDWYQTQIQEKEEKITESSSVIKGLLDDIKALTESSAGQLEVDNSDNRIACQEVDIVPQHAISVQGSNVEHSLALESAGLKQELERVINLYQTLELKLKESEEEIHTLRIMLSSQSSDSALVSLQSEFHETKAELDMYRQRYADLETLYKNSKPNVEIDNNAQNFSGKEDEMMQMLHTYRTEIERLTLELSSAYTAVEHSKETLRDLQNRNITLEKANENIRSQLEALHTSYNELEMAFKETQGHGVVSETNNVTPALHFMNLGEHELQKLCSVLTNENEQMRQIILAHSSGGVEQQSEVNALTQLLALEKQKVSDLHELFVLRDQEATNLKARLEIRNVEVEDMSKELKEHLNVIKLLKAVQDGHSGQGDQLTEEDGGELDLALYLLHQKEVRCDELTLELMQLLEERDTLQLRLSTSLRTNEELRRSEASGVSSRSMDVSPTTPASVSPVPPDQPLTVETMSGAELLADKLDQLRSVGRQQRQMALQQQRVGSAALDANYTLSRDAQSTSETLLNWIWGRSTPKVVHI